MPRARRIDLPAATHHVVNRGVDRRTIFFDDRDRVAFGRLIGEASERFGISIVAYCLMDNHYHLIVHCPDAVLSASMQFVGADTPSSSTPDTVVPAIYLGRVFILHLSTPTSTNSPRSDTWNATRSTCRG